MSASCTVARFSYALVGIKHFGLAAQISLQRIELSPRSRRMSGCALCSQSQKALAQPRRSQAGCSRHQSCSVMHGHCQRGQLSQLLGLQADRCLCRRQDILCDGKHRRVNRSLSALSLLCTSCSALLWVSGLQKTSRFTCCVSCRIGKHTAQSLARLGATVLVHGRSVLTSGTALTT